MTFRLVAARPRFGPDLVRGAAAGLAVGIVLAVVVAVTGFPEWGEVVWGFALIIAGVLLSLGLTIRLGAHGVWAYAQQHTAPERQTPTPDYMLSLTRPMLLGGAAAAGIALVLTVVDLVGTDSGGPF